MDRYVISRPIRVVIAIFVLATFALYLGTICSLWRADWLQHRPDLRSLEASAHLQPWNAQTQWMLGQYSLNATQDYATALTLLQRAVKLNPYKGRYWLDLAAAYQVGGETNKSQEALERALRAEPTSTEIAWETANFYLAQNDIKRALPLLRVALQHDPKYATAAIELSWRVTRSVQRMINETLPAQPAPYFALLKLLVTQNQSLPASEVWRALIAQSSTFPTEEAFPYFDYLIHAQLIEQAKNVWADLIKVHPELQNGATSNLISDSGFEMKFVNGGFGWRRREHDPVNAYFDTKEFHSGVRSLQIAFTGPAVSDFGLYQYIPVQPSTTYRFGAYVKTKDLITASGPRLAVEDSATGKVLASTDEFLDTSGWSKHSAEFVTGTDTHLVTLRLVRIPGNLLIKGAFWLDDVELTPIPPVQSATP